MAVDIRSVLLFLLPTPLLFAIFGAIGAGAPVRLLLLLAAYASLMLGAWLAREGQRAHAEYDAREIASPPAYPRKLLAAGLAGIGVGLATWVGSSAETLLALGGQMVASVVFAVVTAGAHVLAFGIDPMKAKGMAGTTQIHAAEIERVTEAIGKAEAKLDRIEEMARRLRDREIAQRVHNLNEQVRQMIAMVEKDPRDMGRARRYLGVYLQGAEDSLRKYAEAREHGSNDEEIRQQVLGMLTDLEASFARGRETLLADDRIDLEVEIEVLRDRLGQESVR